MLRLDYEELERASGELKAEGDTFQGCIEKMTQVIQGLPDIWEAETCDKYVEQYNDAKKTLDDVRELIQEMAEQMDKIAANFREVDMDMSRQM